MDDLKGVRVVASIHRVAPGLSGRTHRIAQVRTVLKEDTIVGTAMKNVKLSTPEDQLTLTGQVQLQELKTKVANRVEDIAQGWDVNNKLSIGLATR